jgi:signal transduction histidine kinase
MARDIHDDLGSRFLQISVLGELSQRHLNDPARSAPHLEKLRATAGEAFAALDEIVWAANPKQDSLEGLASYLREFAPQYLSPANIQCRLDFPSPIPARPLRSDVRHNLFLIVKEALRNVVKHANATEVSLQLEANQESMVLRVKDNGRGFDSSQSELDAGQSLLGNGLANLRCRATQIRGHLAVRSSPGQGTEIILKVPI